MSKFPWVFIGILVLLFVVSTGGSYALFSSMKTTETAVEPVSPEAVGDARGGIDPNEPRTETCPLNGQLYTKTERAIWEGRRPLGVMIENHTDARPQSGLNSADIVYEAVAEGGITRFMGVFYCGVAAEDTDLGPVRSARTYFLDWISEYGEYPLYAHVGGANCNPTTGSGCQNGAKADAIGQIQKYGWNLYNDMNQMVGGDVGFKVFRRDNRLEKYTGKRDIAIEHTMYTSSDKLYGVAENRGLTNVDADGVSWDETYQPWSFKEDSPSEVADVPSISIVFWENQFIDDFKVTWAYDSSTNSYVRSYAGQPHLDLNSEEPISAKNVVVLFMKESRANDGYDNNLHLLYANKGTGTALVFQDGTVIEAKWRKKDRETRTIITDASGEEIALNAGRTWVEVVPTKSQDLLEY